MNNSEKKLLAIDKKTFPASICEVSHFCMNLDFLVLQLSSSLLLAAAFFVFFVTVKLFSFFLIPSSTLKNSFISFILKLSYIISPESSNGCESCWGATRCMSMKNKKRVKISLNSFAAFDRPFFFSHPLIKMKKKNFSQISSTA